MPLLSHKTFATNSLKKTFVWDVWFDAQIVYFNIEHPSIINKIWLAEPWDKGAFVLKKR